MNFINDKLQNSIEIITENFISKIYYGKVHVKFPSGNEKLFEGNVKSYTADIKINNSIKFSFTKYNF